MALLSVDSPIAHIVSQCEEGLNELQNRSLNLPLGSRDCGRNQECKDEISRFSMWADEAEAKGGLLDHALRKASQLRDHIIELLEDLKEVVDQGIYPKAEVTHYPDAAKHLQTSPAM
jgi:hypothetical protein